MKKLVERAVAARARVPEGKTYRYTVTTWRRERDYRRAPKKGWMTKRDPLRRSPAVTAQKLVDGDTFDPSSRT